MPSLNESFGGLSWPVDASGTAFTDLDPAGDAMLAFYKACIEAEYGSRWNSVQATVPTNHIFAESFSPVTDVLALAPSPNTIRQRKCKFPLLTLHRAGEARFELNTMSDDKMTQTWELNYILGPLRIEDERKFGDLCVAVAKLIRRVTTRRSHPAVEDGAVQLLGDFDPSDPYSVPLISSIDARVAGFGSAKFAGGEDDTTYHACTVEIETVERVGQDGEGGTGRFDGVDYDWGVGGDEQVHGLLYAQSDAPLE
jgi:hypothetical protein